MTLPLIICIVVCVAFFVCGAIFLPRVIKTEKQKRIALLVAALATIVCHYSSLLYHWIGHTINPDKIGTTLDFLTSNPNLVLPIYPCNFVMWGCLILALIKDKESKSFKILADFLFLFGIVSGIAGMIANGDYFNPNVVKNYDIYKSCVAHAFMILNILLIPALGYFKLDTLKNTLRTTIGVAIMGLDGLLCSLITLVVGGESKMEGYNAMFLFRTPIDGLNIVKFHIVMPIFIVILFGILTLIELFKYKEGERWWNRIKKVNI